MCGGTSARAAGVPASAAVAACLLSGTAALVYEVVWLRPLGLVVGHTVGAITTVLAVFMAGLGVGSAWAGGALRARPATPRAYALIEAGLAALALGIPLVGRLPMPGPTPLRVAAAALVLLPPTVLMGATLPVVASLVEARGRAGTLAGTLYAANTLGAVAGTLATAFVLLPRLGVSGASATAALLNVAAAAVVVGTSRVRAVDATETAAEASTPARRQKRSRPEATTRTPAEPAVPRGLVGAAMALSGAAALAGEVAWTRALVLLIGPTTYAFAFILGAVILGLAAGSALGARLVDRLRRPARALAAVEAGAALAALAVAHIIGGLPLPVARLVRVQADHMGSLMGVELLGVFALLFIPCALSGAAFPLAVRLVAAEATATAVGRVYAWNTAGAVAGTLLAGLVSLPRLGLEGTLRAGALTSALAGAIVLAAITPSRRRVLVLAGALAPVALLSWALPVWDRELLAGGPYKYAAYARPETLEEELRAGELVFYREGVVATVSVKRLGGTLSLSVDGKVDATTGADMPTQKLLAHLPLLLHPAPRTACVIGLGSGVTVGAALTHPIDAVDAVEISPEVVAASALFRPFNGDALSHPRLRLMVDDGRHHLLRTGRRYDVIISEPSNPWMAGVSPLFTREFYRIGASRLAPGGLFCQWMHLYNLEREDVRTLVGSFTDAFAEVALFLVNEGDALLIGSAARPVPTVPALRQRMARPEVAADLAGIDVRSPFAVASLFVVETPALRDWTAGADRHTDDRPVLEFRAPRALHRDTARGNRQALLEVARRAGPVEPYATIIAAGDGIERLDRARLLERAHSFDWAFEAYADALARDPRLAAAGEGLVRAALRVGRAAEAEARLESLAAGPAPVEAHVALALLAFNQDRGQAALDHLRRALERDPRQLRALGLATEVQQAAGNLEAAEGLAREALAAAPEDPEAAARLASVELAEGHVREARTRAEAVLSRDPRNAQALEVAAVAHAQLSDRAAARRAFEALLAAAPSNWEALTNFGVFEMEGGDARAAGRRFAQSVALNPGNRRAWEGLREAARRLDDRALLRRAEAGLGGAVIR